MGSCVHRRLRSGTGVTVERANDSLLLCEQNSFTYIYEHGSLLFRFAVALFQMGICLTPVEVSKLRLRSLKH